ncbi:MAG: NAD(P)-binding protein [Bacteroidetes bacterium]|nr:NAD(P)-binding protein [Bacteroidota bacterium]
MKEVTIIGAGIAGMTAAMHLIEAGIKTTIIDNTNNIGGRCFSFYDKNINLELDNGQHVCAGIYNNFFQLIS